MKKAAKRRVFVAVVLLICLAFCLTAQAASPVKTGTFSKVVSCSSRHTTTAKLTSVLTSTKYSAALTPEFSHTSGRDTNYLCVQTKQAVQNSSANINESTSYGNTFVELANGAYLYDRVTCSVISGRYYKVPSSTASGQYVFRASFPGATIYENVDEVSSNGTRSLYYRSVSYVPSSISCEIVLMRVGS